MCRHEEVLNYSLSVPKFAIFLEPQKYSLLCRLFYFHSSSPQEVPDEIGMTLAQSLSNCFQLVSASEL